MATFPSITPSYGASQSSSPTTTTVKFGDGYEQRLVFGLNQDPKRWSLNWNNITETNADTITAFLEARAGKESFTWTPPDTTTAYKWICESWTKTINYTGRASISASFRQVFDP